MEDIFYPLSNDNGEEVRQADEERPNVGRQSENKATWNKDKEKYEKLFMICSLVQKLLKY